jgi:hypothetical protein
MPAPDIDTLKKIRKYATSVGKNHIDNVIKYGSAQKAEKELISSGKKITRQSINESLQLTMRKAVESGFEDKSLNVRVKGVAKSRRWFITSAQNNSEVHKGFIGAVKVFCDHMNAEPIAIMTRYANPDKFHRGADSGVEWDHSIDGWYLDKDVSLGPKLMIAGDVKIAATSGNPLLGLDLIGRGKSMIVGHGQMQMRLVATPHGVEPKMLHSTGSCTMPNYGRSRIAMTAKEHHNLGGLYVEMRGEAFYVFQVEADKQGHFYFLNEHFTSGGVTGGHRPLAYIIGDEHRIHMTKADHNNLWGKKGPVETLNPECLVRHDVDDFYTRNHHHKDDLMLSMHKEKTGHKLVENELRDTAKYLNETSKGRISYVVDSNHPNAFGKWLNRFQPKNDIANADFYARYMGHKGLYGESWADDDFTYFMTNFLPDREKAEDNVVFLTRNDQLLFAGIDAAHHGDKGANGARGSAQAFSKAFLKMTTGHSHSPSIFKGAWCVGTWAMKMTEQYAKGIGSWMVMDNIIYQDGARCMITHINGKWRA